MRLFLPTPLLPLGLVLLSAHAFDLTNGCPLELRSGAARGAVRPDGPVVAQPSGAPELFVANISRKPVVGFVLRLEFLNPQNGRTISSVIISVSRETPEGKPVPLPPGSSVGLRRAKVPRLPGGILAEYRATFDLVLYADHSRWGPSSLSKSAVLLERAHAK